MDGAEPIAVTTLGMIPATPLVTVIILEIGIFIAIGDEFRPDRIALDPDVIVLTTMRADISEAYFEPHHSTALIAAAMIGRSVMALTTMGQSEVREPVTT
jgi:hypothetical protein